MAAEGGSGYRLGAVSSGQERRRILSLGLFVVVLLSLFASVGTLQSFAGQGEKEGPGWIALAPWITLFCSILALLGLAAADIREIRQHFRQERQRLRASMIEEVRGAPSKLGTDGRDSPAARE